MQLTLTIHGTTLTCQGTPDELTALTRNLNTAELLTPSDPPALDSADDSTNHTRWAVRQTTPELATIHRAYCNCPPPIGPILDSGYATNPYAYISRLHANGWTEKIAQADCC